MPASLNPLLISYDNNPNDNTRFFIKTLQQNGWDYKIIGEGETWVDSRNKMNGYSNFLRTLPEDQVVVLSDARDVVCVRSPKAFMDAYNIFEKNIVASMELFCEGHFNVDENYQGIQCKPLHRYWKHYGIHPFPARKFANSGLIAGTVKALIQYHDWIIEKKFTDDQLALGSYMVEFPDRVGADYSATLLHSSGFGINAGRASIHVQKHDSPTLAELFGCGAFFLHLPGLSFKGQAIVYEQVRKIIDAGACATTLLKPYEYTEPDWNESVIKNHFPHDQLQAAQASMNASLYYSKSWQLALKDNNSTQKESENPVNKISLPNNAPKLGGQLKSVKNIKIGITISIKSGAASIWTNGIRLNVLIFYKMLMQSNNNYKVCLLNVDKSDFDINTKPSYLKDIDIYPFAEKYEEMDLLFLMGATVDDGFLKRFKTKPDKKIISYRCGNDYLLFSTAVIHEPDNGGAYPYETILDEVWYIPQMHENNVGFFHTLHRANTLLVPFVWDSHYIHRGLIDVNNDFKNGLHSKDAAYQPKNKKVIGVMEPNINLMKFCLIPLMITEESYRGDIGRDHIQKIILTNGTKLKTNRKFLDVIKHFDLLRDQKIVFENRYQTAYYLTQHIDVLVCHQLINPLNYLYLDATYMGYPMLHNAPLVKDLAYYYEGSDTVAGAKQLDYILKHHDANIDEYNSRNKPVLWRYTATNPELVETYDRLISNVFGEGNHGLIYNPETNLYAN